MRAGWGGAGRWRAPRLAECELGATSASCQLPGGANSGPTQMLVARQASAPLCAPLWVRRGGLADGGDRDVRDLAAVHSTPPRCATSDAAFELVAGTLASLKPRAARWLIDRRASNSGRLGGRLRGEPDQLGLCGWWLHVVLDPGGSLKTVTCVPATADRAVSGTCGPWPNRAWLTVERQLPGGRRLLPGRDRRQYRPQGVAQGWRWRIRKNRRGPW